MKKIFYLLLIHFILIGCDAKTTESKTAEAQAIKDTKVKKHTEDSISNSSTKFNFNTNNEFNNTTAVLSGVKSTANNLNFLFDSVVWQSHAAFIDSSWKQLKQKRLNAMEEWATKEFNDINSQNKIIFYPFSGPDFLTVNAFFPDAEKYIMLGLEPVGRLPELEKFKRKESLDYSNDFKKSLGDIFDKSYFITRKMLNDFQSQKVNGLLPILSFFIKKTGNEILDIKYLLRYNQDSIGEIAYNSNITDKKPFGVRVDFIQNNKQKSVYYFKYDVSNNLFNDTTVFFKYINSNTKNAITYIKSASYLLHAGFMSNMRSLILSNSSGIIQDDTGIPYKYFEENNKFDVKLFGQYTKPVSDFPYLSLQKPLQEAFEKDSSKIKKLPFHLGYHWGNKKDVIIFAKKK